MYIYKYIKNFYYKLPGTNNPIANKLDICNHSLGININNEITKVKIDIVIDKELDKDNLSNYTVFTTLLFLIIKADIDISWIFSIKCIWMFIKEHCFYN